MTKRLPFLFLLSIFSFTRCFAQLTLINPSDHAVSLAVGFYVEKGLWKGWNTKGWINVAPHDSTTMLPDGIAGGAFCFCGRIADCDQGYTGNYPLFVHPTEAFSIANAAAEVPLTLNKGVQKVGFAKVDLPAGQRKYRLRLPATNFSQKGIRTGDWLVYLDRDKEEVAKPDQAAYVRHISYQQGVPTGLVRDYYWPANTLQWDGKLLKEHPATKQGTCISYDEAGHKREEAFYQDGRVTGSIRRWDETNKELLTRKRYRTVHVLQPQVGYLAPYVSLNSSRSLIPVQLPANTVSWFYEFTAYRDQAQMRAAQQKFQLLAQLTRLADDSGFLEKVANVLTAPPGGDICNVYLISDPAQSDLFQAKQTFTYLRDGTRSNLTSAVVPVINPTGQQVYLGLHNPAQLYGINYALEVVAVVEEDVPAGANDVHSAVRPAGRSHR
ncbi:MAG: DUF1036 domain-containing protein [Janthinobacterium lividum]